MSKTTPDEIAGIREELEAKQAELKALIERSANPIPEIYANGFEVLIGGSDCALVYKLESKPLVRVRLSPNTAKQFQMVLNNLIGHYENSLGSPLLTGEEVSKKLTEYYEKQQGPKV
ncbi:MAG: DUF3467 domain-containing protein [Candidatus Cloacimonetes bacterium]|nr:DUF3467 domain-containing protein [Candidatus Cloacimonadota bacterium]